MAAFTITAYNSFRKWLGDCAFGLISETLVNTDAVKLMLLSASYTPNIDADDFLNDVRTYEVSNGSGYTTNGFTIAGKTNTQDNTNDRSIVAADAISQGSFTKTFRYAVLYRDTGGADSARRLMFLLDFGAAQTLTSETLAIAWDATTGIAYF